MVVKERITLQDGVVRNRLFESRLYELFILFFIVVFSSSPLIAQDTVTQKLNNAKAEFDTATEKAKDELLKLLHKKEEAAKKAGNLQLFQEIEAEAKLFEEHDEMPVSVSTSVYDKQLLTARRRLAASYKDAISRYTKDGNIELAKAIQKELIDFEKSSGRSRIPIPKDAVRLGNRAYLLFREKLTWQQAVDRCVQLGGQMACPTNEEQNVFLTKLANDASVKTVWIGTTDQFKEGVWVQTDRAIIQYSNWSKESPNNYQGVEHVACLLANRSGVWWDLPNDPDKHAYLFKGIGQPFYFCEWITGK
jgi:hypothetical protein